MTVPKCGFARTFTHGAGVTWPGASVMTYSRPSGVKPPRPLNRISPEARRARRGVGREASRRRVRLGLKRGTRGSSG
jgi:hypothetical protein